MGVLPDAVQRQVFEQVHQCDDAHQPVVRLDGRRYSLSRVDFDWNDPSGPWTLITLGDLDALLPAEQVLLQTLEMAPHLRARPVPQTTASTPG